jgi:4-oxalocrotonate tautomerase
MKLASEITKAVMATLNDGEESVSVAMEEVKAADWTEKVYKPDILAKRGMLTKNRGTNPDSTASRLSSAGHILCGAKAQRIDYQRECCGGLAAAWIEEVIAGIRWAPVRKHPLEAAFFDVLVRVRHGRVDCVSRPSAYLSIAGISLHCRQQPLR